jgi:hypothetical protein
VGPRARVDMVAQRTIHLLPEIELRSSNLQPVTLLSQLTCFILIIKSRSAESIKASCEV